MKDQFKSSCRPDRVLRRGEFVHKSIFLLTVMIGACPAQTFTPIFLFNGNNGGGPSGLIQASDGNYYGVSGGGVSGYGTIFRLTPDGTLTTIYNFAGTDGKWPVALAQGTDGNFYGTTSRGGAANYGTVFKITLSGVLETLHSFTMAEGYSPDGPLIQATDGNFYGVTREGGAFVEGAVFKITPAGVMTILHSFSGPDGWSPTGGLVEGGDGNLYGVTNLGGAGTSAMGTVFKITPSGNLTTIHSFNVTDGSEPAGGLILASDGNFYGTTYYGGSNRNGTVFSITPDGVLTTLHNFSRTEGYGAWGALLQGGDGNFYGAMQYGDTFGSVFKMTPGGALTTLYAFSGSATLNGIEPNGSLIQGSDGNIYGTALQGGHANNGLIFAISVGGLIQLPAVITGSVSSVSDSKAILSSSVRANGGETRVWFQYSVNSSMTNIASTTPVDVGAPPGMPSFMIAISGLLANITYYVQAFASNSDGTSNGSIVAFTTAGAPAYDISGAVQFSGVGLSGVGVVLSGTQGATLPTDGFGNYSFTVPSGGNYTITPAANGYTFVPPNISFTNLNANQTANFAATAAPVASLTVLASFTGKNGDASTPRAGLIQGSDGNFYGTTANGGSNNLGTIFKITPSGALTLLHSFSGSDGSSPQGPLLEASSGNIYGTTFTGGAAGLGTVYQFTSAGALTTLKSFGQSNDAYPEGALIQATNGNVYGMTAGSGPFQPATVFDITPAGAVTTVQTFAPTVGNGPASGLVQGSDGNFYGTVYTAPGFVFKMTPSGILTVLYTFCSSTNCADGSSPNSQLVQGVDGNFYGTTALGGISGKGILFKITPTGALTVLHSFTGPDGSLPGGLMLGTDGNFYGYSGGGANNSGTIFQVTPADVLTTLYSFSGTEGALVGTLTQGADGSICGVTAGGGTYGQGTVFRLNLPSNGPIINPSSGVVSAASFQPGLAANSWITVLGSNLSTKTDTWASAIQNGVLPQSLDGVTVTVGQQPAYIAYVSPGRINVLAPNVSAGEVSVTVSNQSGTSAPIAAVAQVLQPAFFQWGNYAVATGTDYSLIVKSGTFRGLATIPAKPSDTIVLWGTGFGPTFPASPTGLVVPNGTVFNTANPVMVSIGGVPATVLGAALTPGEEGLYQIAIKIPTGLPNGDFPVVATVSGVQSPSNVLITIQQ
jgi:uncharacterized protein (TIGR03437 family)